MTKNEQDRLKHDQVTNDNNMIDDYGVECGSISEEQKLMDDIKNCKCTYRQTQATALYYCSYV